MSKWQPIETAPKKVEFRCLGGHEYSVVTMYWDGEDWINERAERSGLNIVYRPTHWMPLPEPPTESEINK